MWGLFLRGPNEVLELEASMAEGPQVLRQGVFCRGQVTRFGNIFNGLDLQHSSKDRMVYEIRDSHVETRHGAVIWKRRLVAESTPWPAHQTLAQINIASLPKNTIEIEDDDLAATVFPSHTYYHFLVEDLPALLATLEHYPAAVIVRAPKAESYVMEVIELLGLKTISADQVSAAKIVFADKSGVSGFPQSDDIVRLRNFANRVIPRIGSSDSQPTSLRGAHDRLYVSRRLSRRPVPGELEVEALAELAGFQVVYLESMSFTDQVRLFREAAIVVGFHGAGFANLVFAGEGTEVREVISSDFVNHCFEHLSSIVGARYTRFLVSDSSPESFKKAFLRAFE